MATAQTKIIFSLLSTLTGAPGDFGNAQVSLDVNRSFSLKNGTLAYQANNAFADSRSLPASGTENIDLSGVLANQVGETIALTKIKALVVMADGSNLNDVVVGGHPTAAVSSFFGDPTDKVKVKPGGMFVLVAPDLLGYAVTATTADLLTITNSGAGSSIGYSITVVGV